ncbi:hypothetical protein F7R01_01010 [Pseudomonas argentinensis]|nr:hypothetical protein F7R01_01010 [Pseudomonas argentinensis]
MWSEEEYAAYLGNERHLFAWCLVKYGAVAPAQAQIAAKIRYPYESADEPHRGLIFHDEAWHWAMLHLFGESYCHTQPDLESPSPEYRSEVSRQLSDI